MNAKRMLCAVAVLAVAAVAGIVYAARPATSDLQAVEQANTQFYTALNEIFVGDAAPMQETWSHADDVTYMGPAGGFQIGWAEVSAQWETQAARKLGGKVEPVEARFIVGEDLAIAQCYEIGENLDAHGRPQQVSIRATNLFRKENGQWKMIGHHTDLLPFLETSTLGTSGR